MATCPTCRTRYPDDVAKCSTDGERLLPDEAFSSADVDLPAGSVVGEYRVEHKLGEGGFGSVYRASHPVIGKLVAIKVLNRQWSSNPQMVSRFIAEAKAVNQIRHKGIIDIFSFGVLEDGRQYFVMELLEGITLDRHIKSRGRIPPEEAIPILRGVARALDAAHAAGIAHRDLKPENVFLTFDDEGGVVPKLLDFGIAKLLGESTMSGHKTRTGTPIGTPHYMSPEQCRGKNVDHRTDIYSFGVVAHEVLTGQMPFTGDDVMDLLIKHSTAEPPAVSSVCRELSNLLDAPIKHMLAKAPEDRPPTLSHAVESLAQAARDAGHDVKVLSTRTPAELRADRKIVATEKITPAELGAMADARTVVQGTGPRTILEAASDVPRPTGGKRTVVLLGAGFVVLGVAIGLGITMGRGATPTPNAAVPAATPEAAPSAAPAVTAASSASAAVVVTPETAEIEVTIQSTPPHADVYLGTEKLGSAPGPLKLKRGDRPVKLTIKADGFKPAEVDVTPTANVIVPISLNKAASAGPGKPKKPGSGELEF